MAKHASGRFLVRISEELHKKLKVRAAERQLSLNALCAQILERGVEKDGSDTSLLSDLQKEFKDDLLAVLVFGSQVQGRATESSDEDWLVVLRDSVALTRELYRERDRDSEKKISLHFAHLPKNKDRPGSLWLEVALSHQYLLRRSQGVPQILGQLKDRILNGEFLRLWSHGHPYWVYEVQKTRKEIG